MDIHVTWMRVVHIIYPVISARTPNTQAKYLYKQSDEFTYWQSAVGQIQPRYEQTQQLINICLVLKLCKALLISCPFSNTVNIVGPTDGKVNNNTRSSLIAKFMGPAWGPPGADRTQLGPMLVTWNLLSGFMCIVYLSLLPAGEEGSKRPWVLKSKSSLFFTCAQNIHLSMYG